MKEIAGQIKSGNFTLNDDSYKELKRDYLALVITIIDIVDGAAYLFEKKSPDERKNVGVFQCDICRGCVLLELF